MVKDRKTKVLLPLSATDKNIFSLLAVATAALRAAGYSDEAKQMRDEVTHSANYEDALQVFSTYGQVM